MIVVDTDILSALAKVGRLPLLFYYGTNEYNFEKLENPPVYEPTRCSKCGAVILLSEGGYSQRGNEYWCGRCTYAEMADLLPRRERPSRRR